MTTDPAGPARASRRRSRPGAASRVLVTGVALTATGALVTAMADADRPAAGSGTVASAAPIVTAPVTTPPAPGVTIVVVRRSVAPGPTSPPSAVPPPAPASVGRATPATRPAAVPPPAARSAAS